jgi:hypothetical protein
LALELIGAGFGRTGTLSLKRALERLGFGPCYHMQEAMRRPDHSALWMDAVEGRPPNWDALFEGFRATVDWPGARYWEALRAHWPDARVILSRRDPDAWYDSVSRTIFPVMASEAPADDPTLVAHRAMTRKTILEATFGGRFEDRAHAIAVYEAHNAAVIAAVPSERLLIQETGAGWAPLCEFLDVPVPDEPYPRTNTADEFPELFGR